MAFDARLAEAWSRLPDYLGAHVLVSLTALAIGLGISLPVAIASRATIPWVSNVDGMQNASHAAYALGSSRCSIKPGNLTVPSSPILFAMFL